MRLIWKRLVLAGLCALAGLGSVPGGVRAEDDPARARTDEGSGALDGAAAPFAIDPAASGAASVPSGLDLISGSFSIVLGIFLVFMIALYTIQFVFCFYLSSRSALASPYVLQPGGRQATVLASIFRTRDGGFSTWFFVLAAFFLPLLLGLIPDAAQFTKDMVSFLTHVGGAEARGAAGTTALLQQFGPLSVDPGDASVSIRWSQLVVSVCTVALTVLITIEVIYIANFKQHEDNRYWYNALLAALILDIMTLIIMSIFSNSQSMRFVAESGITNGMILLTTTIAVAASLIVVLCVRQVLRFEAGEIDELGEIRTH